MTSIRAASPVRRHTDRKRLVSTICDATSQVSLDPAGANRATHHKSHEHPWPLLGGDVNGKKAVHRFIQGIIKKLSPEVPSGADGRPESGHQKQHGRPPLAKVNPRHHQKVQNAQSDHMLNAQSDHDAYSAVATDMAATCTLEPFLLPASLAELAFTTLASDLSNVSQCIQR